MLFHSAAHDSGMERKQMKQKWLRSATALLAAVLLAWYACPSVWRLLHLQDCVDADTSLSAPAIRATADGARFVRESGDERLSLRTDRTETLRLFGVLPLRTVTVSTETKTVCAGGEAVGIVLKTQGVQIVGLGRVDTGDGSVWPAASAGLRAGDMILAVNGVPVSDAETFTAQCAAADGFCTLSCLRDGTPFSAELTPIKDRDGVVRIGAWVRDSTSGIGTLSFYDGNSGRFTALGHGVTDVDTQKLLSPATGFLSKVTLSGVRTGGAEEAGELLGTFSSDQKDAIALVEMNTAYGIAGVLLSSISDGDPQVPIAQPASAHLGDAEIRSTVDGEGVRTYRVRVIRVNVQSSPGIHGMMIEIVDPDLLARTGGIVQGMSGSPLIQDGRLIGVVTHVFVGQPTRGYCLYAAWMLENLSPST